MRVTFNVRIGEDRFRNPIPPGDVRAGLALALKIVSNAFGGVTLTRGIGAWLNHAGELVEEPCVSLATEASLPERAVKDTARMVAEDLRQVFNQQSVIVSVSHSDVEFIKYKELANDEAKTPQYAAA